MNKKNLNIVLIVGVALIWGILIYKYINGMVSSEEMPQTYVDHSNSVVPFQIEKDTFDLKEYQRDPFLGKRNRTSHSISTTNSGNTTAKKATKAKPSTPWPNLQYLGFVKEEHSKKPLLLLKINGKLYRKKSNAEFIEDLKILKFYKDSIIVSFQKEKKTIKK